MNAGTMENYSSPCPNLTVFLGGGGVFPGGGASDVASGRQPGPVSVAAQTPASLLVRGTDTFLQVHGADAPLGE